MIDLLCFCISSSTTLALDCDCELVYAALEYRFLPAVELKIPPARNSYINIDDVFIYRNSLRTFDACCFICGS